MRSDKRVTYQKMRIEQLQDRIKDLEQENKALTRENLSLSKINDEYKAAIEAMKLQHEDIMKKYSDGLSEIEQLKGEYIQVVVEANRLKREYTNKMQLLLGRLRKNK